MITWLRSTQKTDNVTFKIDVLLGEHPRMGALDVCPFIPIQGANDQDCIDCAEQFGRLLSDQLGVPVFLYGMAASKGDHRKTLPQIRAGEYEAMQDKARFIPHNSNYFNQILCYSICITNIYILITSIV